MTNDYKIKKIKNDITRVYELGSYKIYFDTETWKWLAVNAWKFGVDSDSSLVKLKRRIKELVNEQKNKFYK